MMTATCDPSVSNSICGAQIETCLSDLEISRRVLQIRASWTVGERVRRRREAEQRFADLVENLMGPAA